MAKLEYKLLPCVFCTIGFNSYVAVNKMAIAASKIIREKNDQNHSDNMNHTNPVKTKS